MRDAADTVRGCTCEFHSLAELTDNISPLTTFPENLTKRVDFMRAYDQLCSGRTAMDKAQRKYDRTAALFEEYLLLHRDANAQLTQLKDRFIEVSVCALFWLYFADGSCDI